MGVEQQNTFHQKYYHSGRDQYDSTNTYSYPQHPRCVSFHEKQETSQGKFLFLKVTFSSRCTW